MNFPWIKDSDCKPGSPMCHDCAFRKDSKEMTRYTDRYGESMIGCPDPIAQVGQQIHETLTGKKKHLPFFCHHSIDDGQDVPQDENGLYLYDLDERGVPQGVPVCNGWKAMVERFRKVMTEDGETIHEHPDADWHVEPEEGKP